MTPPVTLASVLPRFFTRRLIEQRHASPHTVGSYRDTFRLLLRFTHARTGKEPSRLKWEELDAPLISAFLDDLEQQRGITARSRNLRLTAIRSLFRYAAFELPEHAEQIQRVLAIPSKRYSQQQVGYLTREELDALLDAPDQSTWSGRRDHAWLLLVAQTGLRLSELTGLTRKDVHLGGGAYVNVVGKGRKERSTPLTKSTAAVLHAWLSEPPHGNSEYVFSNRSGGHLSNDGIRCSGLPERPVPDTGAPPYARRRRRTGSRSHGSDPHPGQRSGWSASVLICPESRMPTGSPHDLPCEPAPPA